MGNALTMTKPVLPTIAAGHGPSKGNGRMNINWQDEALHAVVLAAHKEGLSATQIMFRIHDHYIVPSYVSLTRNAVIGGLARRGITNSDRHFRPKRTEPSRVPAASKQRARRIVESKTKPPRLPDAAVHAKAKDLEEAQEIVAQYGDLEPWERLSIPFKANGRHTIAMNDLDDKTCRWPFECDEPDAPGKHTFCGAPVSTGSGFPYCGVHSTLASGGMPPPRRSAPRPSYHRQTR